MLTVANAAALDGADVVRQADKLYEANDKKGVYDLLVQYQAAFPTADILWRLARAEHDLSLVTGLGDQQTATEEKKRLVYAARDHAAAALALDSTNFACHKWAGITLSDVGDFEGTKAKLSNTYVIKAHFENAVKLNPKDATSHYLLGYLCFVFADMSWATHQIASVLFATPPTCTYERALEHFQEAEKVDPNFYKANQLKLAECYDRLRKTDEAKAWVGRALAQPVANADDAQAHKDAVQLAKKLGVPVPAAA